MVPQELRSIVKGVLTVDSDGRIYLDLAPESKPLLVVEGLIRFDSGDLVITNRRRYWIINAEAKLAKLYNVNLPKDVKRKIKGKKARVILEVVE